MGSNPVLPLDSPVDPSTSLLSAEGVTFFICYSPFIDYHDLYELVCKILELEAMLVYLCASNKGPSWNFHRKVLSSC